MGMDTTKDLPTRAAAAATAVERLQRAMLISTEAKVDPVTKAYVMRLQHALARIEDESGSMLDGVTPDAQYRPISLATTAERNP